MQEEVVESEGTVLENRLTYKKRCVRVVCVAWIGEKVGEGGPGGSPDVCGRGGGDRRGKGHRLAATTPSCSLPVCGEEEGLRWEPTGHTEPVLLLTRGCVDDCGRDRRNELQMSLKGQSSCCGRFCQAERPISG